MTNPIPSILTFRCISNPYTSMRESTQTPRNYQHDSTIQKAKIPTTRLKQSSLKQKFTPDSNLLWGDPIETKLENTCQIILQNINGISKSTDYSEMQTISENIHNYKVDILGLMETNLNWNSSNCHRVKSILWNFSNNSFLSTCSKSMRGPTSYLPGRTATWSGRASSGSDPTEMGRWSEINFKGKYGNGVTIITAYRVPKASIESAG